MRLILQRVVGLSLQGIRAHIMSLPVSLAVPGRSWGRLFAKCWLGATFDDWIMELGVDRLDILAVGESLYVLSSGEQTGCCSCFDASPFRRGS